MRLRCSVAPEMPPVLLPEGRGPFYERKEPPSFMHDANDGILALLQDIKEMAHGIVLILAGIFLCVISARRASGRSDPAAIAGPSVLVAGSACTHHGFPHHKVIEN